MRTCRQGDYAGSGLQIWSNPSLNADQVEAHSSIGEAVQGCIPNSMQLWPDLPWEMIRQSEIRMKECWDEKSVIAEHACMGKTLSARDHLNCDVGLEFPVCWMTTLRSRGDGESLIGPITASQACMAI